MLKTIRFWFIVNEERYAQWICSFESLFSLLFGIVILQLFSDLPWSAPHWLPCGMHKKISEMVSIICFWWVPKVCRCQSKGVRPEVHRIIWYILFEAPPTAIFMLKEINKKLSILESYCFLPWNISIMKWSLIITISLNITAGSASWCILSY